MLVLDKSKWLGHPHTLIVMQLVLDPPYNYPTQVLQSGYCRQNTSEGKRSGDSLPFFSPFLYVRSLGFDRKSCEEYQCVPGRMEISLLFKSKKEENEGRA